MKKILLTTLCASSLTLGAAVAWACDGAEHTASNDAQPAPVKAAPAELAKVSVDELATLLGAKAKSGVQVLDANNDDTRAKMGVIPGATLLTSVRYDVKELPADKGKKLVFYCANEHCGASHMAARRAREAGHQDVAVMPAGISGWKAAGKATSKRSQS